MLLGILRFEWRYHTRQVTFLAAAVALAFLSAMLVGTGYGQEGVDINAPYVVMQSLGLLSLAAVFVLTMFCANAALRDTEHGMAEIIFATPVGKPRYLAGRFTGALLAATTVMAIAALVLMVAPLVLVVEPDRIGAVRPMAYVWAMLVLVIPNLVLIGALLFAVAILTRSPLATYVGGVAIYALYIVCALLIDSPLMAGVAPPTPEKLARAALLDPFGLSAFFEQTRYWTPSERDVRYLAFEGRVRLNRMIWLGVSAGVMALAYWRFALRVAAGGRASSSTTATVHTPPAVGAYRPVQPNADAGRALWPAMRSTARLELRHVLRGWTFLALLAMWTFVAGMEAVAQLGGGEYGTRVLATTGLMLDAIQLPLLLLGTVTIVYYAAEVAWRERIVGFDPLVDATPSSSAVFYFAKAAALCALPMIMTLIGILVGLVVQLAHGQLDGQPALYLSLFWFAGVPLALFAIGALALQALASNRWLGMLGGLALALIARRGGTIGLEHPMLRFGDAPSVSHSDMDGFGPAMWSFAAFTLYWTAAAALLACVSWGVWRRGMDAGVRARLGALPRSWGRTGTRIAVACAALFAIVGGALFWQTNVAHAWEGSDANAEWKADYERTYRRLEQRAQPSIVAVRTTVDFYPSERRAEVAGTYALENRTSTPIDTLWVVVPRSVARSTVTVTGANLVRDDTRFGVRVFVMKRPLAPGARGGEIRLAVSIDRGGIRASGFDQDVAANGSFLANLDAFPTFGYRPSYELADAVARRKHGLVEAPSRMEPLARSDAARAAIHAAGPNPPWLTIDATLSTSADQTALGPGRLVRAWESDGRRYFHYEMAELVTPRFAFVSARYDVRRVRHRGVDVEVWYHPTHAANVERILAVAVRSLDLLGARYGAYPYTALRIAEVPVGWGFGAFALPGMVYFTEDRGFLSDPRDGEVDLVTRRVAHEVAHQWWGHALDPADMPGASMLVETLAKHSEQLVVGDMHGEQALPAILAFDEDRYLAGRAQEPDSEPSMLETSGQSYLYYGKGAVMMNALRDLLGASAVDSALARLVATYGGPYGAATSLDLRDVLRAQARTADDSARVMEWLAGQFVYDVRVDTAVVTPVGGVHRVTASIGASKFGYRGTTETSVGMDGESIDVAVYDGDPQTGRVLYAGKHEVSGGRIEVSIDVSAKPAFIVVDPFVRRIDRDRTNNRRALVAK